MEYQDINSVELAERLNDLVQQASADQKLADRLLQNPAKQLKKANIELGENIKVYVEYYPEYGFTVRVKDNAGADATKHVQQEDSQNAAQQTFNDQHFMDCHHH